LFARRRALGRRDSRGNGWFAYASSVLLLHRANSLVKQVKSKLSKLSTCADARDAVARANSLLVLLLLLLLPLRELLGSELRL
jgi:hypothetical protein